MRTTMLDVTIFDNDTHDHTPLLNCALIAKDNKNEQIVNIHALKEDTWQTVRQTNVM